MSHRALFNLRRYNQAVCVLGELLIEGAQPLAYMPSSFVRRNLIKLLPYLFDLDDFIILYCQDKDVLPGVSSS